MIESHFVYLQLKYFYVSYSSENSLSICEKNWTLFILLKTHSNCSILIYLLLCHFKATLSTIPLSINLNVQNTAIFCISYTQNTDNSHLNKCSSSAFMQNQSCRTAFQTKSNFSHWSNWKTRWAKKRKNNNNNTNISKECIQWLIWFYLLFAWFHCLINMLGVCASSNVNFYCGLEFTVMCIHLLCFFWLLYSRFK